MHSRKQYLLEIRKEYEQADMEGRGRLLDEAQKRTRLNRKYLIRMLNGPLRPVAVRRRRRRRKYGAAVGSALVELWEMFDFPCGQRLAPLLRGEVGRLRRLSELRCSDEVATKLQEMSPKTIDRLLVRERQVRQLRRGRNPATQPLMYQRVPVKVAAEWDTREVGNVQVDYVAHCGRSNSGEYVHTISAVDIASGWWEGVAIARRSQQATEQGLEQIRQRAPFRIKELHPDNDSGLLNDLLWRYCRHWRIRLSRSRPYRKNDNAWVEQKNWTHVRKVVGYGRYDSAEEVAVMNQLYEVSRLFQNFFQPVMKLQGKQRIGGRIQRSYDVPQTPYERLVASGQLKKRALRELRGLYESLNPAELHRRLRALRDQLFDLAERKLPVVMRPKHRGPGLEFGRHKNRGLA